MVGRRIGTPHSTRMTETDMDLLQRFSFSGLPIRGQWIRLDKTLRSLAQYADYPDDVKRLLGEMFAAVTMADNLKFSGAVSLQSKGDGALTRSLQSVEISIIYAALPAWRPTKQQTSAPATSGLAG